MEKRSELSKPISYYENQKVNDEFENLFQTFEVKSDWRGVQLRCYHGFWCHPQFLQAILSFQKHFRAKDSDIIIASEPKSGTTWVKALTFSIVNRHKYRVCKSPILSSHPHDLIPFFEINVYAKNENPNIECIPEPRIFSTHIPYQLLPNTVLNSESKIVYICRNPLDLFVSYWYFYAQNGADQDRQQQQQQQLPSGEALELFCEGVTSFGPFWDHILGYWHASLKNPEKILFLKYEDLKKNIICSIKKIADFLNFPFSAEEEGDGFIEDIARLCSFENLKNLEVNKKGEWHSPNYKVKNSSLFRKGEVGDWANHLSPSMVKRLQDLMEEKFSKSNLIFEIQA